MVKVERRERFALRLMFLTAASLVTAFMSVAEGASANISTPPPTVSVCGIMVILAALNFPVNLSLYGLLLLATLRMFGKDIAGLSRARGPFLREVLTITLSITLLGALIDFVFVYLLNYGEVDDIVFNAASWAAAAAFVFASIYAISWLVIELRPKANLVISGVMAALNPIGWALAVIEFWWPLAISVAALVVAPFAILLLRRWHTKEYPAAP